MINEIPLYKYMSVKTAKAVFQSHTLRWSTPALFNDPFDVQFDLHIDCNLSKVKKLSLDKLWKAFYEKAPLNPNNLLGNLIQLAGNNFPILSRDEFDKIYGPSLDETFKLQEKRAPYHNAKIQKHMALSKILCLSEINNSLLMWAHYADDHKGLVFKFQSNEERDGAFLAAKKVVYSENMPRLMDENSLSDLLSGSGNIDVNEQIEKLTYTKAKCWEYENEWRICAGNGRTNNPYEDLPFNMLDLSEVILGCNIPPKDGEEIISIVRKSLPHVTISEAVEDSHEYKLVVKPVI